MNLSDLEYRLNWYVAYKHVLSIHEGSSADRCRARRGLTDIIAWLSHHGVSSLRLIKVRSNFYFVSCLVGGSFHTQFVRVTV